MPPVKARGSYKSSMPSKFRVNALIIVVLAVLFYLFFMTSKHDPAFSAINPFVEDPYDAMGSFGIQAAAFLSILSMVRAFLLYRASTPSEEQKAFLVRTQMFAVLVVLVTLVGDIAAMARYPLLWVGSSDGSKLAVLLGGLTLLAIVAGALVFRSTPAMSWQAIPSLRKRSVIVSFTSVIVLVFYPDHLRQSIPGALLTIIVGTILLFAPTWALGTALVPYRAANQHETNSLSNRLYDCKYQLGSVVVLGILLGLFLFLGELLGEGGVPLVRLAFVASVYVGLETTGVLIGYSFLEKPLGLFQRHLWQR